MAKNVLVTRSQRDSVSNLKLLEWINDTLECELSKIEQLCTGAAYCQLMHCLFPHSITLRRVKFCPKTEYEYLHNYKLLQAAFTMCRVEKDIPVEGLISGKHHQEFLVWYYKFFHANCSCKPYRAFTERNYVNMGHGDVRIYPQSRSTSHHRGSNDSISTH